MDVRCKSSHREIKDGTSVTPTSERSPGPPPKQPTKNK